MIDLRNDPNGVPPVRPGSLGMTAYPPWDQPFPHDPGGWNALAGDPVELARGWSADGADPFPLRPADAEIWPAGSEFARRSTPDDRRPAEDRR